MGVTEILYAGSGAGISTSSILIGIVVLYEDQCKLSICPYRFLNTMMNSARTELL